jgi:hypothetical protein
MEGGPKYNGGSRGRKNMGVKSQDSGFMLGCLNYIVGFHFYFIFIFSQ